MKKIEYKKPEVHIHNLVVESCLQSFSSDNTETEDQGVKRYDNPIIDDSKESLFENSSEVFSGSFEEK